MLAYIKNSWDQYCFLQVIIMLNCYTANHNFSDYTQNCYFPTLNLENCCLEKKKKKITLFNYCSFKTGTPCCGSDYQTKIFWLPIWYLLDVASNKPNKKENEKRLFTIILNIDVVPLAYLMKCEINCAICFWHWCWSVQF